MKTVICTIVLLACFVGYSQNPISFGNNNIPKTQFQYGLSGIAISPLSFNFTYFKNKNYASGYVLEVYNPTTQLNDIFVRANNTYYLSNIKSFPNYSFEGMKMDSFNPYGTSDFGGAVVSGLINLLISPKSGF